VKVKLENKNVTLEQIIVQELNFSNNQLATVKGISTSFDKLGIVITKS
jgi:hypothetical protein